MASYNISTIEERLEEFFRKFPPLPPEVIKLIVVYGPYLVLLMGIADLFNSGLISTLNLGIQPFFLLNPSFRINFYLAVIFNVIIAVILILSFKPLVNRKLKGWKLLFYANLLALLPSIIIFSLGNLIVQTIGFYLLYQIKSYYS